MFERYTERARRSIFFARYEASELGTREITPAELLLGILREDKTVAIQLNPGAAEAIRTELERLAPPKEERVPTSVDMPVSEEMQRALAYAAEEAEAMHHKHIDAPHLALGLLRVEEGLAAKLLRKYGMAYEQYRRIVAEPALKEAYQPEPVAPPEGSLHPVISILQRLVDDAAGRLRGHADTYGGQKLSSNGWTRKEALGHLIDWAIVHQQLVTQAPMESRLKVPRFPEDDAIVVQHYSDFPWEEAVDLWVLLNRLLIHTLPRIPEDKLRVPCRIGAAHPVPLARLMEAYVTHCQDLVGQILARLGRENRVERTGLRHSAGTAGGSTVMFELYSERARRAVFFALREAHGFRCPSIMTEHLLLGILREDPGIAGLLNAGAPEAIRQELEQLAPPGRERIPTDGDLPLSEDTKRALQFATEEYEALHHKTIDTPHLILGLLRVEECTAAKLLRQHGMDYQRYREIVGHV